MSFNTTILPLGYTRLEYIEQPSGNSGYIKSGVLSSDTLNYEAVFMTYDSLTTSAGAYGCIFGCRVSSLVDDYQINTYKSYDGGPVLQQQIRTLKKNKKIVFPFWGHLAILGGIQKPLLEIFRRGKRFIFSALTTMVPPLSSDMARYIP